MKRKGYLFEKAFSHDNLLAAFYDAAKSKRKSFACYEFERRLIPNIDSLHKRLWSETYEPKPYNVFLVREPKPRVIYAPAFEDVVVQHAIYRIIYDIFDRTFIDQSFACRKGKGTHAASDYAQRALRATPDSYTLKLDIERFFYSIDRNILKSQIRRKIKDKRLLRAMDLFIWYDSEKGIPIGNLLSQIYALIYLNPLDHFIKRTLKIRWYCRYVDDFILFGLSLSQAHELKDRIERFLADELGLRLSRWGIEPSRKGVNFVGYRTWRSRRFIRKHSLYTFKRAAKRGKLDSVVSLLAHARHTSSFTYMQSILRSHYYDLYLQLPKVYRRAPHG